ncbi:MAG: hypothetical protein AAF809_14820, partial [Bacteroidota bacterium]
AERGAPLVARTQALLVKHRWAPDRTAQRPRYRRPVDSATVDSAIAASTNEGTKEPSSKPWWKLW